MIDKFAVIGNPVAHSRSPEIHTQFAQQFARTLQYDRILATADTFEATVKQFFVHGGKGLNVTVPFKEQAFELATALTDRAKAAGAVNTLWQQDSVLIGDNTDGAGLVRDLSKYHSLNQKTILIIGAGGATRGVILPLLQADIAALTITNRTFVKAQGLVDTFKPFTNSSEQLIQAVAIDQLQGMFDIVINATSASLTTDVLAWPSQVQAQLAYEMAYGKPSLFLQQAAEKNVHTVDGLGMLTGQAAESFYCWYGEHPDPTKIQL